VYGFPKADRDNISEKELKRFKIDAKNQFSLTDEQIEVRLRTRTFIEITEEDVHRVAMKRTKGSTINKLSVG
jgi:hypothetical protein